MTLGPSQEAARQHAIVALVLLLITAFSFAVFPGHTYLQQDTQIYLPILEHEWDPSVLGGDLIVARAHVSYTFYDELALALRTVTRLPFEIILKSEQLVFRAVGFLAIFLLARSANLQIAGALTVTALCALGAAVHGPEVLTIEYEPSPRSFAIPLLLLSAAMFVRSHYLAAGAATAGAILLHAPTAWPMLAVAAIATWKERRVWLFFAPVAVALGLLLIAGGTQHVQEKQHFFSRLAPLQEQLQRMRASYNYVSTWLVEWFPQYAVLAAVSYFALRRLTISRPLWLTLGGLTVAGLLSVPLSWLFLEGARWVIIPQVQPTRALLFVTAIAKFAAAAAGVQAAQARRYVEAGVWFFVVIWIPTHMGLFVWAGWRVAATVTALAVVLGFLRARTQTAVALACAPLLLWVAGIRNYMNIETPELAELAAWARTNTSKSDVFAFPNAGKDRSAGWFRATALRPVYADWKGGGQVNYLEALGYEWWRRWKEMVQPRPLEEYLGLGFQFVAFRKAIPTGIQPVFHNKEWTVYRIDMATLQNRADFSLPLH